MVITKFVYRHSWKTNIFNILLRKLYSIIYIRTLIKNINFTSVLVYIFLSLSLFVDFFLNLDLSSGGSSNDFNITFPAVINLIDFNFDNWSNYTRHFPLHYFLLSIIHRFVEDQYFLRLIYIFVSFLIPIFIYLSLENIYKDIDKNKLFIFSSTFLLFPFIRSSIVWPNAHITGFIFFLLGFFFLEKFLTSKRFFYLFFGILFLSLSVYSVQYYAIFFGIFLFRIFEKFEIKQFLLAFSLCAVASLPGFYFIKILPYTGDMPFSDNLFNVIIINFSIICFYLLFFFNKDSYLILLNNFKSSKINKVLSIFLIIFILFAVLLFDYEYYVGGGFIYKFSIVVTGSKLPFYLSAIIGGLIFFNLEEINKNNFIKKVIVFMTFFLMTSSYMIFQKYFEPTFILICFFFIKSIYFETIFKKNKNFILTFLFLMVYLSSSIIYTTLIL